MLPEIESVKGVHPGAILKRELRQSHLKAVTLAKATGEHPQTISAILNEKRGISPKLSVQLGQQLQVSDDYFMVLQAHYEVRLVTQQKHQRTPNLSNIRSALFWDTTIELIDWERQKKAVILRVFERGNEIEIAEITSFYGEIVIENIRKQLKKNGLSALANKTKI